jgi:hypothetical protein
MGKVVITVQVTPEVREARALVQLFALYAPVDPDNPGIRSIMVCGHLVPDRRFGHRC